MTGRRTLEEDGSNLAISLRSILGHDDSARELSDLIRGLLPLMVSLDVERRVDTSLLMSLREHYGDKSLPTFLLSDGTIGLTALVVALFFENRSLVAIEEPERNVHPRVIPRVVELPKEAARTKQVIVTTHSPQVVESSGIDNVMLVSRDADSFSRVTRPADREAVRVFLENEIGAGELFAQNLLDA